ncbi:MAG: hypothetical protein R2779_08040 [Crocinitomicaceae bacterium]
MKHSKHLLEVLTFNVVLPLTDAVLTTFPTAFNTSIEVASLVTMFNTSLAGLG